MGPVVRVGISVLLLSAVGVCQLPSSDCGATSSTLADCRCALNPVRGGANMLHGKSPWHRASRDAAEVYFAKHAIAAPERRSAVGSIEGTEDSK